jgi:hypothetical protein
MKFLNLAMHRSLPSVSPVSHSSFAPIAVLSIARMNSTGYALILMIDEDDGSQEWA